MKQMVFEIPVGKMPAKKKRWWQFWRKKGDSAEEAFADIISRYKEDIDWKHLDRSANRQVVWILSERGQASAFPISEGILVSKSRS